ncbi:MAG: hypothetical protein Q4G45_07425 [Actinomycetia bacterium]|nr:hypothetical protein [Actinomycetes bacterium]
MTHRPDAHELARRASEAAAAQPPLPRQTGDHSPLDVLAAAAAGLPDPGTADQVLAHAEECDDCAAQVAGLETVTESLYLLQSEPMPDEVAERLLAVVAEAARTRTTAARAAQARLEERTTTGSFGSNLPRSIDPDGLGLTGGPLR